MYRTLNQVDSLFSRETTAVERPDFDRLLAKANSQLNWQLEGNPFQRWYSVISIPNLHLFEQTVHLKSKESVSTHNEHKVSQDKHPRKGCKTTRSVGVCGPGCMQ